MPGPSAGSTRPSIVWIRRDLRCADHPPLWSAASEGPVVVLFVLDEVLRAGAGATRGARMAASLRAFDADLRERYAAGLLVRSGPPSAVVPALAREIGARTVWVSGETTPYGRHRDESVRAALAALGAELRVVGTPYAVGPGTLHTGAGTPFRVFTPFARAWRAHGAPGPAPAPATLRTLDGLAGDPIPDPPADLAPEDHAAGEQAALAGMTYDEPGAGFEAWQAGRTGYPFVDAGMRQLAATGWMHNRVRMVTASFLVKDLHVWWPHGARHFLQLLRDGDLASNSHGWQWTAGTGTDATPYFRIFNPIAQGRRFDPHGDYVRRWVPELAHLPGAAAHEPWKRPDGYAAGYPEPILDHAQERAESLRRFRGD